MGSDLPLVLQPAQNSIAALIMTPTLASHSIWAGARSGYPESAADLLRVAAWHSDMDQDREVVCGHNPRVRVRLRVREVVCDHRVRVREVVCDHTPRRDPAVRRSCFIFVAQWLCVAKFAISHCCPSIPLLH